MAIYRKVFRIEESARTDAPEVLAPKRREARRSSASS
jgi:hypothetical protein